MDEFRITKYNPLLRDDNGDYSIEEWTSFTDIGKKIAGLIVTYEDYKSVEDSYLKAIELIMHSIGDPVFKVLEYEPYQDLGGEEEISITENSEVQGKAVLDICKQILREKLWCKLESTSCYFHFGYDYYMYVGISENMPLDVELISSSTGLFIEKHSSPYS